MWWGVVRLGMVGSGEVWCVLVRLGEVVSGEARYSGEILRCF